MDSMARGKKQYGLQLQIKAPPKKLARQPPASAFRFDDGGGAQSVEDDIARQASKKRTVRDVEQQHKKALEEDPSAFDYDGVYEEMKGNQTRPIQEDRAKREPKYIGKLLEKAKERAREHDVVYERQLAKEREKEDHLYGDKEKFVTGAYKKKLMEQAKWQEEERLRELHEQKHEVTNKSDMSDFYRNLLKNNVAFGGRNLGKPSETTLAAEEMEAERPDPPLEKESQPSASAPGDIEQDTEPGRRSTETQNESREEGDTEPSHRRRDNLSSPPASQSQSRDRVDRDGAGPRARSKERTDDGREGQPKSGKEEIAAVEASQSSETQVARPSTEGSIAAAKERYLARKRQRGV